MKIGELSRRSGVPASALRYYEKLELLPAAARAAGARRYTQRDLHRVQLLKLAKSAGFSLEEIKGLMKGFAPREPAAPKWRVLAHTRRQTLEDQRRHIDEMLEILAHIEACECADMEECARRYTSNRV